MNKTPNIGDLVYSLAGRDSGKYYLVVGFDGPHMVLLANGLNRPLKRPKRKNLRHLQIHRPGPAELVEKLQQRKARDEEIARAICSMVREDQPGGEREGKEPDVEEKRWY